MESSCHCSKIYVTSCHHYFGVQKYCISKNIDNMANRELPAITIVKCSFSFVFLADFCFDIVDQMTEQSLSYSLFLKVKRVS